MNTNKFEEFKEWLRLKNMEFFRKTRAGRINFRSQDDGTYALSLLDADESEWTNNDATTLNEYWDEFYSQNPT